MSSNEWKKKNMTQINCRFMNHTGIPSALKEYLNKGEETQAQFMTRVISEQLIRLGYPPANYIPSTDSADE